MRAWVRVCVGPCACAEVHAGARGHGVVLSGRRNPFHDNTAQTFGGAIFTYAPVTVQAQSETSIRAIRAGTHGGALFATGGTGRVGVDAGSTFVLEGNVAQTDDGKVYSTKGPRSGSSPRPAQRRAPRRRAGTGCGPRHASRAAATGTRATARIALQLGGGPRGEPMRPRAVLEGGAVVRSGLLRGVLQQLVRLEQQPVRRHQV